MKKMKKSEKKVSIIIPVYNAGEYLDYCINSLLKQTYKNLEIIFVDDGSKDNSLKKLKQLQKSNINIKVFSKKNGGVASSRNYGLNKATGEYVMFMDNDDKIDLNYIEEFVKVAENEKLDIVIGGYVRESYEGKILFQRQGQNDPIAPYILIAPWGKLYRSEFIKKYHFLETSVADEFYFNIMAYHHTKKMKVIDNLGYHWMFNNQSLSNTSNKALQQTDELLSVLTKIYDDLEHPITCEVEYFFIRTIIYYLLFACKNVAIDKIMENYKKMHAWLIERVPSYSRNCYIRISKNSSESLKIRIAIKMFIWIEKLHFIKPFMYFYSKFDL